MIPQIIFISVCLLTAIGYNIYKKEVSIPVDKEMFEEWFNNIIANLPEPEESEFN